jgi:tetratricopeptide (TPR) repeat protein
VSCRSKFASHPGSSNYPKNPGKWIATLLLCLALPRISSAQQQGNVILDSNEQLFCVLAAINSAGYDAGLGVDAQNNARSEVRTYLAKQKISALPELRRFYADHQTAGDTVTDLGQYVSLALLLSPPPDFHATVPANQLPPDAKAVAGLIPLLKNLYQQADLIELWSRLQPFYQAEMERYSDPVRKSIALSDAYLRYASGAYLGRTYNIYVCLLGAPNQVQARIYGQSYNLVVTPSKELKIDQIRHQYLHFLLDALPLKYATEIHQKEELLAIARKAPMLAPDFKEDFPLLVTECLIRAVELRMDKVAKPTAAKALQDLAASGLILAPYFYDALGEYKAQDASMSVYYRRLILGVDVDEERKRLASVKFAMPSAPAPAASEITRALSPEDRILSQGDNLIYEGKYREAHDVFMSVLQGSPKNARALYGMAVAASNLRKPDTAEEYFRKALEVARDLRIVTWSHIYLGRIYDLEGKRNEALEHYRTASLTATAYPNAVHAVQGGLQKPFGSK